MTEVMLKMIDKVYEFVNEECQAHDDEDYAEKVDDIIVTLLSMRNLVSRMEEE